PSGVDEAQGETQVRSARSRATVFCGRVLIDCCSADIYDGSGRRVFSGSGPIDVRLPPGIYFARVTRKDDRLVTGTITVVR
ncbi:T9SS type A sorting domain-containing protein, partial [candidate division WOR-3 bacterium]|nr:T9SS type A sorting domain-containing protein [candidate division WOR-3 bacterium]